MPPLSTAVRVGNHQMDLSDMLLAAGVGQYVVQMALPYMNFLSTTTEPYSQSTIVIVKGLQRLLNKRGAKLAVDGGMGIKTQRALVAYAGPRWADKTWAQLYADVLNGAPWQGYVRNARGNDSYTLLGAERALVGERPLSGDLTDLLTNPLALAAGGFLVWWKFFRKERA